MVFPHRQEIVFFEMDTLKSRLSNVERFAKLLVSCQNAGRQWQRALHLPLDDSADGGLDAALASFVRASRGPAFRGGKDNATMPMSCFEMVFGLVSLHEGGIQIVCFGYILGDDCGGQYETFDFLICVNWAIIHRISIEEPLL